MGCLESVQEPHAAVARGHRPTRGTSFVIETRRAIASEHPDGVLVLSPGHAGSAVAADPDHRPIDAGAQLAAPAVVQVEGVQLDQQGHGRERSAAVRRPRGAARRRSASRRRHADPPPPAVLGVRPVLLFDLEPAPRRPALVHRWPRPWRGSARSRARPPGPQRRQPDGRRPPPRKDPARMPATTSSSLARRFGQAEGFIKLMRVDHCTR